MPVAQALRPSVRRALVRHALLTGAVAVVLCGVMVAGIWMIAQNEAVRIAQQVSTQVAGTMTVSLSARDYRQSQPARHNEMVRELAPFLQSGMVARVKVWRVEGGSARIVFSDEARYEGEVRTFRPALAARLDAGEAVAEAVPDDDEHRFEIADSRRLVEVYIGFTDAVKSPMRLEVYIPVDVASISSHAMAVLLPFMLAGLLALGLLTIPLTVALARRMERDRRERHEALRYGLAASERERRELAQQLHDGVIQDLAGTGLLLDAIRGSGADGTLLDRAHRLVENDVRLLRSIATELLPPAVDGDDLQSALVELADRLGPDGGPVIEVDVRSSGRLDPATVTLLHQVARELLRNAVRHGMATRIDVRLRPAPDRSGVELTVSDDGVGFDPDRPPVTGHLGLQLVQRAVADAGGTITLVSEPGAGTAVTAAFPGTPVPARVSGHGVTQVLEAGDRVTER